MIETDESFNSKKSICLFFSSYAGLARNLNKIQAQHAFHFGILHQDNAVGLKTSPIGLADMTHQNNKMLAVYTKFNMVNVEPKIIKCNEKKNYMKN